MTQLAVYEHAKEALAAAVKFDEVTQIHSAMRKAEAYARIAKDRKLQADAAEIVARAERKLGIMLRAAKDEGLLSKGGRPAERSNLTEPETGTGDEPVFDNTPFTLADAGIDKKLSSRAQKAAALDDEGFEVVVSQAREKILSSDAVVINTAKDVSTAGKKAARAQREADLGKKQIALPVAKFGVIYADPEWKFKSYSDETGMDRAADNHYPTSDLETIKRRDVGSLAANDSICWLWVTVPMLLEGIEVLKAWGFTYKSHLIWNKDRIGTGYWFRNKHELLLIGTRGKIPAPAMGDQFPSVIDAPVGEHSAKPEKFYEIIEAYFPTLPKIELNARQAREGWVRWGYEAPEENTPEGSGTAREASGGQPLPGADNGERDIGGLQQGTQSAPHHLAEAAELREAYEGEIALLAPHIGKLTMKAAEPALRAGRAASVSPLLIAQDLGHPLGTVKTWLNRLGLTSLEHMHEMNAARAAGAEARKAGEP
jgi:N6-adenosine-specific RNA methylase IME4